MFKTHMSFLLLVETEQSDEDQDELNEEDEFENDNNKSGIIFEEFRFVFFTLL